MKCIYNFENIEQAVLGKQELKSGEKYRLLRFCAIEEINGEYFAYNKLTGKIFLLTESEFRLLQKLPQLADNALLPFVEEWCAVPENTDDTKLADQFAAVKELMLKAKGSGITAYTVLPTTDCNARCSYCYEHGIKKVDMSDETAEAVAEYIIKKSCGNEVSIRWFGGEPLFNKSAIDIICRALDGKEIKYRSSMISNAYFFDCETVDRAKNLWKLKRVQITLDGTQDNYNRIKAYYKTEDKNPFKTVTDNIEKLLLNGIKVVVRINLSEYNYGDLCSLVDWLARRYPDKELLSAYAAVLFEYNNRDEALLREMLKKRNALGQRIIDSGLGGKTLRKFDTTGCMAQNDRSVVITPTGMLSKCEHFVEGEKLIGSIYNDKLNEGIIADWKHRIMLPECRSCPDYVICGRYDRCPNFSTRCDIFSEKRRFDDRRRIITAYNAYKTEN